MVSTVMHGLYEVKYALWISNTNVNIGLPLEWTAHTVFVEYSIYMNVVYIFGNCTFKKPTMI